MKCPHNTGFKSKCIQTDGHTCTHSRGVFVECRDNTGVLSSDGQQTSNITAQDQQLTTGSTNPNTQTRAFTVDYGEYSIIKQLKKLYDTLRRVNTLTQSYLP